MTAFMDSYLEVIKKRQVARRVADLDIKEMRGNNMLDIDLVQDGDILELKNGEFRLCLDGRAGAIFTKYPNGGSLTLYISTSYGDSGLEAIRHYRPIDGYKLSFILKDKNKMKNTSYTSLIQEDNPKQDKIQRIEREMRRLADELSELKGGD